MNLKQQQLQAVTRRHFLAQGSTGIGSLALGALLAENNPTAASTPAKHDAELPPYRLPTKAKSVIFLHMAGSPPQQELFDYKPELIKRNMQPCPDSFLKGRGFPFIKGHPKMLGTPYQFKQYGESGTWMSELLPHFQQVADEITVIKSMHTDQFNHAPAQLFLYTGSPRFGGASMGSWITYGLGSENKNLPGFMVLLSGGSDPSGGKSLWGSGFLPSVYQGVQCRTTGDPILYVSNPKGINRDVRRRSLDALKSLNEFELKQFGNPETLTRINQYELAFRMQMSVPEAVDLASETKETHELYGTTGGAPSFANNCLLARRMVERGVRYIQLFDYGWDMHGTSKGNDLITGVPKKTKDIDRPLYALISDLKQRGLLDETLVVWSGEFGRTSMNEERNGSKFLGRDHHPHCYTIWMAGGGIKKGFSYGQTDELGYFVAENKTSVRDLQSTILHLTGFEARKFKFPYQGLDQRLIGPADEDHLIKDILA
ncbi:MAG: sulfatase [Gimesia sp.]|uniref:Sulfatase n=1 Tax=Gimesia maris TaxID=122 RepID=A0A3D3R947_9PLAN|nr:sulfatase [Gimesia sp.]HCO25345.1 sulfatase [Gimesia maris]|tara:strand:+ start:492 stop:1949 length:1458 start_codon:yes stop_codon:yes gene_type:complete